MAQILLELNHYEQTELSQWLQENAADCSLRSMYDNFTDVTQRELCGVEDPITVEILDILRCRYGHLLKSDLRFA